MSGWCRVNAECHHRGQHVLRAGKLRGVAENNGGRWWNWWITWADHDGEGAQLESGGAATLREAREEVTRRMKAMGQTIVAACASPT